MTEIEQLRKMVEELRERVAELEARPVDAIGVFPRTICIGSNVYRDPLIFDKSQVAA